MIQNFLKVVNEYSSRRSLKLRGLPNTLGSGWTA